MLSETVGERNATLAETAPHGAAITKVLIDVDFQLPFYLAHGFRNREDGMVKGRPGGAGGEPVGADHGNRAAARGPHGFKSVAFDPVRIAGGDRVPCARRPAEVAQADAKEDFFRPR